METEVTLDQLINAGTDLNKTLNLDPPINVSFEPTARGAAAKAQEGKFLRMLKAEIISLAEFQDKETGVYDLQEGDVEVLSPDTIDVIKKLSPEAAKRLVGTPESKEEQSGNQDQEQKQKPETETKSKPEQKKEKVVAKERKPRTQTKRYTRSNALVEALKNGGGTKEQMISMADALYKASNGKSNPNVAKALLNYVLPSLIILKAVKVDSKGVYKLA